MNGQVTHQDLRCYRIGDPQGAFAIFDATGSTLFPGRWNTSSTPILYTSQFYSTSLLEKLVYSSGIMPPNQHYVEITAPSGSSYEMFDINALANRGWDDPAPVVSRSYGDLWAASRRSLMLIVPSVVARIDTNILFNPSHPEFAKVRAAPFNQPVHWDRRLFGSASASP